jgi:hypothetical protein
MPEAKTKTRRGQSKTKSARATITPAKKAVSKKRPALLTVAAVTKPKAVSRPKSAEGKRVARKTAAAGLSSSTVTAPITRTTIGTKSSPTFQPLRPLTPLPQPVDIAPQPVGRDQLRHTMWRSSNAPRTAQPHRWSLRHNVVTILVLTLVGCFALTVVAMYANLTFDYIAIYGTSQSALRRPVELTERSFQLTGNTFVVTYPASYNVAASDSEQIEWQYTQQPTTAVTLRLHRNDTDNVFTWLQANQPDYSNAKVITPTTAVEYHQGILVTGTTDDNYNVTVAYWPYQKNLAEKYIVEVRQVVNPNEVTAKLVKNDLEIFVEGIVTTE